MGKTAPRCRLGNYQYLHTEVDPETNEATQFMWSDFKVTTEVKKAMNSVAVGVEGVIGVRVIEDVHGVSFGILLDPGVDVTTTAESFMKRFNQRLNDLDVHPIQSMLTEPAPNANPQGLGASMAAYSTS